MGREDRGGKKVTGDQQVDGGKRSEEEVWQEGMEYGEEVWRRWKEGGRCHSCKRIYFIFYRPASYIM